MEFPVKVNGYRWSLLVRLGRCRRDFLGFAGVSGQWHRDFIDFHVWAFRLHFCGVFLRRDERELIVHLFAIRRGSRYGLTAAVRGAHPQGYSVQLREDPERLAGESLK